MTRLSTTARNPLLHRPLRQTVYTLKVGTIYGLLAIAIAYTAVLMLAIVLIGVVATSVISLVSLVLNPLGDSIIPKP
ncbi:MAG: hypothetical protein IGR76_06620 [Synechococcales cyanobacterium T60_A2020_003]|nr:hypothetical protein [Synechococcales cyanobacterium T60_A2020_003]